MKLVYLAQIGIMDNWAHTVQIMKMCEAFSQNGYDVTLISAKRRSVVRLDPFEMYGVKNLFKIVEVPYVDINQGTTSKLYYWIRFISYLISSRIYLFFQQYDVIYTREILFAPFFRNVYLELHFFPKEMNDLKRNILKRVSGIVVLTSFIKSKLEQLGIFSGNIFVAHDAVRIDDFINPPPFLESRKKLGISEELKIIGYIGSLKTMGMEKGVGTAILSLNYLPKNYRLYVVGGVPEDIDFYKKFAEEKKLSNGVFFAGIVPHKDVNLYTSMCDVLVAPFPDFEHYRYYMSPLKIFEYMASKKPIVVTNLPTLSEVLNNEEDALFIPPENPKALADAIIRIDNDDELKEKITSNAYNKVINKYNWKTRANEIIHFMER